MNCCFCLKEISNAGSLSNHEKYWCKSNPNRIVKVSNFVEYNKKVEHGQIKKHYTNQHTKANLTGKKYIVSEETKIKLSIASSKQKWSEDRKNKHSNRMLEVVRNNPLSYSAKNVCGRTKKIKYKEFELTGKWEYEVALYLDKNNIKWTNKIEPFTYRWGDKNRNYFPDFYLIDLDLYLEVKGYETDRDLAKWSVVPNLMVIKKDLIETIKNGGNLNLTK